jgi:phosphoadenylyl-sulfate reductase (thioredoxin)
MSVLEQDIQIDALNAMAPQDLLRWAYESQGERVAIITSFQNTGCVMIDMVRQAGLDMRVLTVDTLRLPRETYALMGEIEKKYGLTIERFQPDPARVHKMVTQHGEYLFFDSKPKQEYCCSIRKVEPNNRALETVDVWITGLRRDHSSARESADRAEFVKQGGRRILKLSPLVEWSEDQVWAYIKEHGVPYNALYDHGYTSIGCDICTTPTRPGETKRAGRWRWFNYLEGDDKECGIHVDDQAQGSGI